ncbi:MULTISPECIES: S-type pyocin domain-containing protein [Pseudomonas syringae group]|uniref:S-type pyocin domain-containing protein n=1 Tax=Pseudomonas syringae group TaxID=136849 RepID=UPI0003A292E6|nr:MULTISPECIES: S-type pyocin domain-containing protein [Pseudomonas syringae group]KPW44358.1 Colicin E3 [Pseudomonas syringae pv. berberidis]KPY14979.1 Colicin E3 [Pseudomonas syringae pv. philadelphi]RMM20419.1 Colicin E3 [Pseudomonas syringae pv. berberidis]RMP68046.1 Colicin E3 [Pseudomonas syringae pv. berberidis]RMQ41826.1 Colicin E3 [Pseudomonas syringae pv. berberidis]
MSGYIPKPALPNATSANNGVEPVDIHAQRWAEYKDLPPKEDVKPNAVGCVFAKSCDLPDGVIDHRKPAGFIPVEKVANYGEFAILGGRETDADGNIPLKKISGSALPTAIGTLVLGRAAVAVSSSCGALYTAGAAGVATETAAAIAAGTGVVTAGVVAGFLGGMVAMLWPSSLGDSSLYTEDQLQSLKKARTRVRLHVEQQADGTLKGYGYNTQKRTDWEMIPVVQFDEQGAQRVADFGDGVTLIWTPAVNPSSTSGIPPLEAAPQAPQIWIYPPTEQADNIIVSPIYPDTYKDFILVFPAGSGVQPLYIVMNVRLDPGTVMGQGKDVTGIWLAGATSGLGAPIPTEIADQLRGKSFGTFDSFRRALWKAVASTELVEQFTDNNVDRMREGKAPKARYRDRAGKRGSFELHHADEVAKGGKVYDVDNLNVVTPKHHLDIHRNG